MRPRTAATGDQLIEAFGLIADDQSPISQHDSDIRTAIMWGGDLPVKQRPLPFRNTQRIHQPLPQQHNYTNDFRLNKYTQSNELQRKDLQDTDGDSDEETEYRTLRSFNDLQDTDGDSDEESEYRLTFFE